MKIWSTKIIVKGNGMSAMDPSERREKSYKVQQMIKELEIK